MSTMRVLVIVLTLLVLGLIAPLPARAQEMDGCPDTPTIQSLRECVQHAVLLGHIDNRGVSRSLLAKLDAAEAALDRGQLEVAINVLEAFVRELDAQAGKHIGAVHAAHLRMHAQNVIAALSE